MLVFLEILEGVLYSQFHILIEKILSESHSAHLHIAHVVFA